MRVKYLKHILTDLYCAKYNDITMRYSDIQKHICYKNSINNVSIFYICFHKRLTKVNVLKRILTHLNYNIDKKLKLYRLDMQYI